jgi:hypothetical protein
VVTGLEKTFLLVGPTWYNAGMRNTTNGEKNMVKLIWIDELHTGDKWHTLGVFSTRAHATRFARQRASKLGVTGDLSRRDLGDGITSLFTGDADTHLWVVAK